MQLLASKAGTESDSPFLLFVYVVGGLFPFLVFFFPFHRFTTIRLYMSPEMRAGEPSALSIVSRLLSLCDWFVWGDVVDVEVLEQDRHVLDGGSCV
jgi:hypothetical protein